MGAARVVTITGFTGLIKTLVCKKVYLCFEQRPALSLRLKN